MTLAGMSRTGTGLWAAAVLLLLLCASPLLYSSTTNINVVTAPNTQNLPRDAAAISIKRRDTAAIPDARRGVAHTNPLKLTPHEPLLFEEPVEGSSPDLSRRSEGLSKRRDGPLYCHDGPCIDNSCCGPDNVCGFGPDFCGEGCRSNCNATAMCGEHSEFAEMPCGMKLCCSASGWCGSTESYCHNADPLRGTLPCQAGYGSCYITGPPSCPYGGGSTGGRHIGYYQSWNVRNRLCNKVSPRQLNTTGYTHLFYSFASIDPVTYKIAHAHPDDPAMMREFTSLAKPGLKTWIAIGGFDFSDKGTPTHFTWSRMVADYGRRAAFISSVKDYMDEYGFTGVDIDWEYPGDPDRGGNKLADTRKLVLLMKEMRAAYGSKYGISLTLAPDYWYLRWFDAKAMEPYVDFFGFMAYDLHGPWDADVKALGSKVRGQADIREISENTKPLWFDGLNPAKLNFGLALYGRGYTLADPTCNQLLCPFSGGSNPAPCTNYEGVMSLHEIQQLIDRKGLTPQYLSDAMMKQITWDDQWIGYDDDETFAAKKAWADSRCFGGTMVWSIDFQVAGSGDSEDEKYGDVVYIGQEVFETPAAQCQAPCIMVFPSSSLSEPKVITMQPYTATLEVGTTTTTLVAVSTTSTTTVTVVNFFNHYVTSGQQPGAVVTLRPSFQPPPIMLAVTGQDGQTTSRTVLPPPLGGGASDGGYGGDPTTTSAMVSSTTSFVGPENPPVPTPVLGLEDIYVEDEDDDLPTPTIDFPGFPPDATEIIEPVIETDIPPPPGKTRIKCDAWFFNLCIDWPELHIKIFWWDIELPQGEDFGPGPLPPRLIKRPPGWTFGCRTPPCSLPPWPKIRRGGGGGMLSVTPPAPNPCKPVTATLTISTTSYGTTKTQGTVRTITTRTMSSEFPILGCSLTDATFSVSETACATPQPAPRSLDERAVLDDVPSELKEDDDTAGSETRLKLFGRDCDTNMVDVIFIPTDPLSTNIRFRQQLEVSRMEGHVGGFTVIESTDPVFVAFFYVKKVSTAYANFLLNQGDDLGIADDSYMVAPPPAYTGYGAAATRKRHDVTGFADPSLALMSNKHNMTVGNHRRQQGLARRDLINYSYNWGPSHLSIPPNVNFNDPAMGVRATLHDGQPGYRYNRHESECQGQYVYIIESEFDRVHPHFSGTTIERLPRQVYGSWEGYVRQDTSHATKVASIVGGMFNGVCPGGHVTLVTTSVPGIHWLNTDSAQPENQYGFRWQIVEALVLALQDIKTKNRGYKSVINMSLRLKIPRNTGRRSMMAVLLRELDKLGVVLVAASGNDEGNQDGRVQVPIPDHDWPVGGEAEEVPNLLVVGSSNMDSRSSLFSKWSRRVTLFAPGENVLVSGEGSSLVVGSGTSYAAPAVAGLVAYWRGMAAAIRPDVRDFDSPATVKRLLEQTSRRVQTTPPGQFFEGADVTRGWPVNPVWNVQSLYGQCIIQPKPGGAGKRQVGESCQWTPPNPGSGDDDGSDGGNGDGGGGGDIGGQDQLGPSKTFTYSTGTPSPTCTSGCGTLCTDFWCRPDRTGQPSHFTEPTRLATITSAPGGGGAPLPTNCISSTTTRSCSGDRQGQICGLATVCVATSCPEGSICGPGDLPPLPGPTSLDCTSPWFSTTSSQCVGSGDKEACRTTTVCAVTPTATPIYRFIDNANCPKSGDVCAQRDVTATCSSLQPRGLPEVTAVLPIATETPRIISPSGGMRQRVNKGAVIKPPWRPRSMVSNTPVADNSESLVSPVSNVLLRARQNTYLICDVESRCVKCVTPRPNIPDPCIEVYMVYTMTTANFQGILYKAELSINGKTVCKMETYCDSFAGSTDGCSGKKNYDCGNGNRVDSWTGERFLFYVKANDKVYDIQAKVQVFEGVWDACNGATFACIPTVFRGKVGC